MKRIETEPSFGKGNAFLRVAAGILQHNGVALIEKLIEFAESASDPQAIEPLLVDLRPVIAQHLAVMIDGELHTAGQDDSVVEVLLRDRALRPVIEDRMLQTACDVMDCFADRDFVNIRDRLAVLKSLRRRRDAERPRSYVN